MPVLVQDDVWLMLAEIKLREHGPVVAFGVDMKNVDVGDAMLGEQCGKSHARDWSRRDKRLQDPSEVLDDVVAVKRSELIVPGWKVRQ